MSCLFCYIDSLLVCERGRATALAFSPGYDIYSRSSMKFCMKVGIWTLITEKMLWFGYLDNGCHILWFGYLDNGCHGNLKTFSGLCICQFWG